MKTIRIYQPGSYKVNDILQLSDSAGQHVGVVLRMKPGELLTLFCGNNKEYQCIIRSVQKRKVTVEIQSVQALNLESSQGIHLAQSISKGDRMEWVIQKATELGVTSIIPIISERTVIRLDHDRLMKKHTQWESIAISACEQCGRNQLPIINTPISFNDYLQQCQAAIKLILHPVGAKSWRDLNLSQGDLAIMIGPEGGFSEAEIKLAEASFFQALKLGPRVLRTETAAIAALSLLQAVSGDL